MRPLVFKEEMLTERSRKNLAILEAIRRLGPVSKAEISRVAGLNVVTTSNYVDHYIRSHLVSVKALDVSTGGRRPALLSLNSNANLAIGVGLNLLDMIGVIADLDGRIVTRVVRKHPGMMMNDIMQCAVSIIDELISRVAIIEQKRIKGIGIGIGGMIDRQNKTIRWPEKLSNGECRYSSVAFPLEEIIQQKFGLSCLLENDATASCFGEQWMSSETDIKNVVYMFSGVGSGFILNGEVYRGASGAAGEVALNNAHRNEFLSSLGGAYFIQPWEDDLGMVRHAQKALEQFPEKGKILRELINSGQEEINLRHIFEAANNNDSLAVHIVRQAGRCLGVRAAFLINLLNPQTVIIGGGMEEAGNIFFDAVKESVCEFAFPEMASVAKVVASRLGADAAAVGAASLVVRKIFVQV
ncbi:MAG: ROK family protein [Candidatus Omnitrophota bacterium]